MISDKQIRLGDKVVGAGNPVFIIAEAGVNHNGDIELAKQLVDVAADAGADAVKFQMFKSKELVSPYAPKAKYQRVRDTHGSQYDMLRSLELSEDAFREIHRYSRRRGIMFLSTPFDAASADFLYELGVPAFKVSSGDVTNTPFLEYLAGFGIPIILSTGMADLGEVERAIASIRRAENEDIILLHCVSEYPAPLSHLNLRAIQTLSSAFNLPTGFSDHSPGIYAPIAAVALGAVVIEKHFTLSRALPGPDHAASLEPVELKEMISAVRSIESALGDGIKRPTPEEIEMRTIARRSIVARVDIPKGTVITENMIAFKRPCTGIPPFYYDLVVGAVARRDIKKDSLIRWWDLDAPKT